VRVAPDGLLEQLGAGARLDRDGEAAGLGAGPAGPLDGRAGRFDGDPALLQQHGAGRGQRHPAAGALEQPHAEPALELADGRRQRRLGQAQAGRGAGEVQLLGDHDEPPVLIGMSDLTGKVALVTGGSRGIGAEIVRRLAGDGADVGFTYQADSAAAAQVAAQVRELGRRVLVIRADLADPAAPAAVVQAVTGEFGRLDILVNNAGITHWGSVAQTSAEDFDRVVTVDARAPWLMMAAAAGALADGGRVVNISSGVTATALAGIGLYSGAKAFVDQVTKVAAVEFAERRITVNAVGPGITRSGPFGLMSAEQEAAAGLAFGLGRIGEPADTAALVAFLASDEAGFITGQVIYNAGGQRGPVRVQARAARSSRTRSVWYCGVTSRNGKRVFSWDRSRLARPKNLSVWSARCGAA
jgi:3-oxoacyl-[acyl-carrier protein] reductase